MLDGPPPGFQSFEDQENAELHFGGTELEPSQFLWKFHQLFQWMESYMKF